MSLRYLFPCSKCEHKFELVPKQAGQDLVCPNCDNEIVAPKLGSLRQLETVGDPDTAKADVNSGSGWKNILFVCGLGMAILAGASGYFLYQYAGNKITIFDVDKSMDSFDQMADEQTPASLIEYYQLMNVPGGLGEWQEQPHVGGNKQAAILMNVAYGLFGLACLGLLMLVGSFVMPR